MTPIDQQTRSPLFSICIPVRNDTVNLKQCLRSFANQNLSDCEIFVCDDGSATPVSAVEIQQTGVEFTLIRQSGRGPAAARNYMARLAKGAYLFFVDADTAPKPQMLENARAIIGAHPQIDAFFGSYDDEPAHSSLLSSYKNLFHHHTHHSSACETPEVTTFWCGCGVIRRMLYLQLGGLSEIYDRPSIEDIELGARLHARGIRTRIFPEMQVKHLKKWTLTNWLYTDIFGRGIPWVRLMRATKHWKSQLNFSWPQRIACLGGAAFAVLVPLAVMNRLLVPAAVLSLFVFLAPNFSFLQLVRRKRGLTASIAVIPFHLIYALVCLSSAAVAFLYPPLRLPEAAALPSFSVGTSSERAK